MSQIPFMKTALSKFVIAAVVGFASFSATSESYAQTVDVLMLDNTGNFYYYMFGLTPQTIAGVDVLVGSGTDGGGTTQGVVVIPTAQPGIFAYIIGGGGGGGPPAGTAGSFDTNGRIITWQNTLGQGGFAFAF